MTNKKKQMIIPDTVKTQKKPQYYQKRTDLTQTEKTAINHYKDLVNPQYKWDYKPKPHEIDKAVGIDCFMVNRVLRGVIPQSSLSNRDKIRLNLIVNPLNTAIKKSKIATPFDVIKGVRYYEGLKALEVGKTTKQLAFGSYSTSLEIAARYAGKNVEHELIFFYLTVRKGDCALYVDKDEEEWILEPDKEYIVSTIVHFRKSEFITGSKAIVYYLERT